MDDQKTTLIQNLSLQKRTSLNNYWPIMCLQMMWKILTAQIKEEVNHSLRNRKDAVREPEGQKRYYKLINTSSTRVKRDEKNLPMARIDVVSQSCIIHYLKKYKITDEVIKFIEKTMETWRVELTAGGKSLAEVKIEVGIFLGDALSPYLTWSREEFKQMDQRTRKLMTMHKGLHPRDDVDR